MCFNDSFHCSRSDAGQTRRSTSMRKQVPPCCRGKPQKKKRMPLVFLLCRHMRWHCGSLFSYKNLQLCHLQGSPQNAVSTLFLTKNKTHTHTFLKNTQAHTTFAIVPIHKGLSLHVCALLSRDPAQWFGLSKTCRPCTAVPETKELWSQRESVPVCVC
mgnify:CR=1 FL=1